MRFASAALAARRTLMPFASRAAAVRRTRSSSAKVAKRRLSDRSIAASGVVINSMLPFRRRCSYTCDCKYVTPSWLQVQTSPEAGPAVVLERLVRDALPDQRGLGVWRSLLRAHASLMRELATDLAMKTRLPLGDFDVLAQLALAGGELRMTDLASKAFSSRSAMTRRVDRMVEEGLVGRTSSESDGRGVVVALTEAGMARLIQTVPVHLQGVSKLFLERLDDEELAVLEHALDKVSLDCSFG